MQLTRLTLTIIFIILKSNAICQNQIDFIPTKNKKTLTFKEGDNIGYTKKGFNFIRNGILHEINDSIIKINEESIKISDIRFIGQRKKGTTLFVIGTSIIAGAALGYLTLPTYNSNTQKIIGLAISIPIFSISQVINFRNKVYNVSKNYTYVIKH